MIMPMSTSPSFVNDSISHIQVFASLVVQFAISG